MNFEELRERFIQTVDNIHSSIELLEKWLIK